MDLSWILILIPYTRHYNPRFVYVLPHFSVRFIIKSGYHYRLFKYKNKEMVFKKWEKNIQTAGYNGACTVIYNLNKFYFNKASSDKSLFYHKGKERSSVQCSLLKYTSSLKSCSSSIAKGISQVCIINTDKLSSTIYFCFVLENIIKHSKVGYFSKIAKNSCTKGQ